MGSEATIYGWEDLNSPAYTTLSNKLCVTELDDFFNKISYEFDGIITEDIFALTYSITFNGDHDKFDMGLKDKNGYTLTKFRLEQNDNNTFNINYYTTEWVTLETNISADITTNIKILFDNDNKEFYLFIEDELFAGSLSYMTNVADVASEIYMMDYTDDIKKFCIDDIYIYLSDLDSNGTDITDGSTGLDDYGFYETDTTNETIGYESVYFDSSACDSWTGFKRYFILLSSAKNSLSKKV